MPSKIIVGEGLCALPKNILTTIGKEIENSIQYIEDNYVGATIDEYVIMSNYIHLIVIFENTGGHGNPPLQFCRINFEVIMMNIGEATKLRIIELCNENMITVNKLATLSGITQSTLNNIVGGRNNSATISTIKKLCDGLNISIREFFASQLFDNLEQEIE